MNRLLLSLWGLVGVALWAVPVLGFGQQVAGYGRDGTRIYPDCQPPVKFSLPQDLRWEFRFKAWGHSSPIIVGDQVLATIEATADCDWPQLVSIDLKTGKERWRTVLDAAEAIAGDDAAKRKAITDDWHLFRQRIIKLYRFREAFRQNPAKATNDWVREGGTYSGPDHKPRMAHPCDEPAAAARGRLAQSGITPDTWHEVRNQSGIDAVGHAYATPVSDGKTVYVATSDGLYAAFDLAGKRLWLAHSKSNLHSGDYCYMGRSPILYKNLWISDMGNKLRAFEAATGKLLWSDDAPADLDRKRGTDGEGAHTIVSPMVLTVGGKDVLWAAGCQAYLLPDGKKVAVEGWKDEGMQTLVKHDERDVVIFCGSGEHCGWEGKGACSNPPPAAVRFAWAGETLRGTVLWSGIKGKPWGGERPCLVYDAGKVFCPCRDAVEALTGKILGDFAEKQPDQAAVPNTAHLLQIANGHVYGVFGGDNANKGAGMVGVCTLDGKPAGISTIPAETFDEAETVAWNACALYYNIIGRFSHGYAFTLGKDCIIVRSNLRMYCIGPK